VLRADCAVSSICPLIRLRYQRSLVEPCGIVVLKGKVIIEDLGGLLIGPANRRQCSLLARRRAAAYLFVPAWRGFLNFGLWITGWVSSVLPACPTSSTQPGARQGVSFDARNDAASIS
jgi:hypothetical protein